MKRVATLLLVPVALAGGVAVLAFLALLLMDGWPEMVEADILRHLWLPLIGLPTLLLEAVLLAVIISAKVGAWWRRGRPARPPEPLFRTMLRYWWAPAVAAAGLLAVVMGMAVISAEVKSVVEGSWGWSAGGDTLPRNYLALLVLLYLLGLIAFAAQLGTDVAARRHRAGAERRASTSL